MSQGARNWPFLTLTARPVAPAASSRSVWRHRKAGICSTSTASATGAHCSASCTSVSTGQADSVSRISARIGRRFASPSPRAALERGAVRLVEAGLVDQPDAALARSSRPAPALISSACARLSSWHGPAISANGRSLAMARSPMATDVRARGYRAHERRDETVHACRRQAWLTRGSHQPALLHRGLDEASVNSGCGSKGLRLQLGMELHADEPGMVGDLDDLGQQRRRATCRRSACPRFSSRVAGS